MNISDLGITNDVNTIRRKHLKLVYTNNQGYSLLVVEDITTGEIDEVKILHKDKQLISLSLMELEYIKGQNKYLKELIHNPPRPERR